jgi:hypothetical protein
VFRLWRARHVPSTLFNILDHKIFT